MDSSPLIMQVAQEICGLFPVEHVILFNEKRSLAGETTSFKLCLVLDTDDKSETERRLYLAVDCDVPFDLLLYSPAQWEHLSKKEGSFANRVAKTGSVIV